MRNVLKLAGWKLFSVNRVIIVNIARYVTNDKARKVNIGKVISSCSKLWKWTLSAKYENFINFPRNPEFNRWISITREKQSDKQSVLRYFEFHYFHSFREPFVSPFKFEHKKPESTIVRISSLFIERDISRFLIEKICILAIHVYWIFIHGCNRIKSNLSNLHEYLMDKQCLSPPAIRQMKIDRSLPYSRLNFTNIFLSRVPILISRVSSLTHHAVLRAREMSDEWEISSIVSKIIFF